MEFILVEVDAAVQLLAAPDAAAAPARGRAQDVAPSAAAVPPARL